MDEFFQKLRKIQKKERNESGLARVGDDFYKRVHRYLEELLDTVGHDPFAKEQYLLRDTQRIATEICERREHKITDSAVMNIQRSYHLFKGKPQFDLQDTTPLNLTPEEEQLYFSLIDTLKGYRDKLIPSLDVIDKKNPSNSLDQNQVRNSGETDYSSMDEGLNILDHIKTSQNSKSDESQGVDSGFSGSNNDPISNNDSKSSTSNEVRGGPKNPKDLKDPKNLKDSKSAPEAKTDPDFKYSSKYEGFPDLDGSLATSNQISVDSGPGKDKVSYSLKSSASNQSKTVNMDLKTMVVFEELPSIVGVDEKVYGPFNPQDVIILPEANAQIFIKARKGRLIRT